MTAPHRTSMRPAEPPAFFVPAAAERPSGTVERNTATTKTQLTASPPIRLLPMATYSGMPSIRAPTVIAADPPSRPWDLLRCLARRLTARSAAK